MQTKSEIMKRLFVILALVAMIFSSCSNKVDLYNNDGDTTIVYAMLDSNADTNFFKITKSFVGDASQLAYDYNVCNYKYDEIDVTFSGVFDGNNQSQTVALDTISIWIPYDENATFYSGCYQTYYYTTKKLKEGEEYTLNVLRKADNVLTTVKSTIINDFTVREPNTPIAGFKFKDAKKSTVKWKVPEFPCLSTAAYFEITGCFHYTELMPGSTDTIHRTMVWTLGADKTENFYKTSNNDIYYAVSFNPSSLYDILRNNTYLRDNSPAGVYREFEDFEIKVSALGEELYNYYLVTNSTSAIQDVPNYTNVKNGMGLMSSRISKSRFYKIEILSREYVVELFPEYGFYVDPNR